jgi:hypothetical protein
VWSDPRSDSDRGPRQDPGLLFTSKELDECRIYPEGNTWRAYLADPLSHPEAREWTPARCAGRQPEKSTRDGAWRSDAPDLAGRVQRIGGYSRGQVRPPIRATSGRGAPRMFATDL